MAMQWTGAERDFRGKELESAVGSIFEGCRDAVLQDMEDAK